MDVMGPKVGEVSKDQTDRCLASPERDEIEDADLDVRTQMLLSKFLSCPIPSRENTLKPESTSGRSQSPVNPLKRRAELISRDTSSPELISRKDISQSCALGALVPVQSASYTAQHAIMKLEEVFPAPTPKVLENSEKYALEQHAVDAASDSASSSDVISSERISRMIPFTSRSPLKIDFRQKGLKTISAEKKSSIGSKQTKLSFGGAPNAEGKNGKGLALKGMVNSKNRKSLKTDSARTWQTSSKAKESTNKQKKRDEKKYQKKQVVKLESYVLPLPDRSTGSPGSKKVADLPCRSRSVILPSRSSETPTVKHFRPTSNATANIDLNTSLKPQAITTPSEDLIEAVEAQNIPKHLSKKPLLRPCILSISKEKLAKFNNRSISMIKGQTKPVNPATLDQKKGLNEHSVASIDPGVSNFKPHGELFHISHPLSSSSASAPAINGTPSLAWPASLNNQFSGAKHEQPRPISTTLQGCLSPSLGVPVDKTDKCSNKHAEVVSHRIQPGTLGSQNVSPPTTNVMLRYGNAQEVSIGQNPSTSTKKNKAPPAFHIPPRNAHEKPKTQPNNGNLSKDKRLNSPSINSFSTLGTQKSTLRQTEVQMPIKPDSSSGQESPVRRSRRSRNAPTNYYARPASYRGLQKIFDEPDAEEHVPSPPGSPVEPEAPPNKVASKREMPPYKVVYQCHDYRITCESLASKTTSLLVKEIGEANARYLDSASRQRFGKLAEKSGVVHLDFDYGEMCALYGLLSGKSPMADEDVVSIPGLVSQAAVLYRQKGGDFDELAHRVRYLKALGRQMIGQVKDVFELLVELKKGVTGYPIKAKKIEKISRYLLKIFNIRRSTPHDYSLDYLRSILKELKTDWLLKLGAQYHHADALVHREPSDIRNFLRDAHDETLNVSPSLLRVVPGVSGCHLRSVEDTSALLRSRELGYATHQNRSRVSHRLYEKQNWELWKTWTGASNDVIVLSWSPDSTRFIAGAAAQTDEHHMQYNRNNNLLLGDLTTSKLKELPDHRVKRPMLESGPNSRRTYVMVDPNLYMTVNAVHWTNCGSRIYTSSFDHTVKIWDVSAYENARCIKTLKHTGRVQEMAVSTFNSDLVATGSDGPIFSLWQANDIDPEPIDLCFPQDKCAGMIPSSLQWGRTAHCNKILAGGMTREDSSDSCDPSKYGYFTFWLLGEADVTTLTVTPNTQNIFDIAWHPSMPLVATGCSVPTSARSCGYGKDVRSLVRIYEPLNGSCTTQVYECPALDINQVSFCPTNENYITASCTDGVTYVWDHRNPRQVLHKLRHGQPIPEIEHGLTREQSDVGVRCSLWGKGSADFFTGASDGVLKRWDIRLSTEDVLREDVATFNQELMCASMSPDYTNIVLGDSSGGIHVISTAPWGRCDDDFAAFELETANEPDLNEQIEEEPISGVKEATDLISSGKLVLHPVFGAGQGPNYNGPYAKWARPGVSLDRLPFTPLDPSVQAVQLDGPAPLTRRGLDIKAKEDITKKIQLSTIRNKNRFINKRKRDILPSPQPRRSKSFQSQHTPSPAPVTDFPSPTPTPSTSLGSRLAVTSKPTPLHGRQDFPFKIDPHNFIDLTLDSDEEEPVHEISTPSQAPPDELEDIDDLQEDHWWPVNVDANLNGIHHDNY